MLDQQLIHRPFELEIADEALSVSYQCPHVRTLSGRALQGCLPHQRRHLLRREQRGADGFLGLCRPALFAAHGATAMPLLDSEDTLASDRFRPFIVLFEPGQVREGRLKVPLF